MDPAGFAQRLRKAIEDQKTNPLAASRDATGGTDTIRNWLRRADRGEQFSMRHENLVAVARALNVSPNWLMTGATGDLDDSAEGFGEDSAPFVGSDTERRTDDTPLNVIRLSMTGGIVSISATLNRAGLAKLRRKLDDIERLLDE